MDNNEKITDFVESVKDYKKFLCLDEGFTFFEFGEDNSIDLKESFEILEIDDRKFYKDEYNPTKLITTGLIIGDKMLLYTKYDDIIIFILI